MTIAVKCHSCATTFRVKEEHAGKQGKCPRCQAVLEVPALAAQEKADPEPQPPAAPSGPPLMQEILQAFHGDVEPVRRTAAYGFGILTLSITLLVLPGLYLALIAVIVWLLYHHATQHLASIGAMRNLWALLFLYVAPLLAGVILLFFLVKPIFAGRSRAARLRTLEFGEEPLLFALVTRVAQVVGAPEPRRIDVDSQVNASASFGSALGVLFGGDLVLTVGLPLASGLSIQQFAGVIAHELGHFSQGAGMRLSFVVRSINGWFARIVYERDDWDEWLVQGCEEGDRLSVVFHLARFCVGLTRVFLWAIMMIGHVLSCFMMRQMEYDADRYEARLAGSGAFGETMRTLLLLDLATSAAYALAHASWYGAGKLPDDLSTLILNLSEGIPAKEFRKIEKDRDKTRTGLFDTHPAHGDRLASVRRENAPGVFHMEGPATHLFKDFPRMSRAVTFDFYRNAIGKRVKRNTLVPVADFLQDAVGRVGSG